MSTIKNFVNNHNYIAALLFMILGLSLMIALTACGGTSTTSADPGAKAATSEEETVVEEPSPPAVNNFLKQFGEVVSYDDGVSISVALVGPFSPGEYAIYGEGETPVVFKIVLTNNSTEVLEPGTIAQANSGGKPATYIADVGNPEYGDLGLFPTTSILPGQTLEWFTAFGVADVNDITLEITPAPFEYDNAIFTNIPF